jgi:hypothetical protein
MTLAIVAIAASGTDALQPDERARVPGHGAGIRIHGTSRGAPHLMS